MKVSYQWLKSYVDLHDISPADLAEKLTNSGVAVDIVEKVNVDLDKVVIGYVLERERHPEADKLSICKVDVGEEETLQIICGAANVDKGQKVPVALVGAKLPDGTKIKKAKLRGIESIGMICSADELGMNEKLLPKHKTEGILVLPEDAEVGSSIEPLLGFDDYILELDLTPNRSDCLSMIGVAYEVAAILERDVILPEDTLGKTVSKDHPVKVTIEAEQACKHYAGRLIKNVTIKESPQWLQNRLSAAGIRPINNVVDITNFVMLEYGQPLHAFDFKRLEQPEIVVRMAKADEKIVTLDEQERALDNEMLLITDGVKPIAIAGVMGAANSEVTEGTTEILLESAYFDGFSVRRTSKKLGLRSEASLRFEKGVDPNRIYLALNRASEMLQKLAGGEVIGNITEDKKEVPIDLSVTLRTARVNEILGTNLNDEQVKGIMERLQFTVEGSAGEFNVLVPTRRQDISREIDLIEEVARLYGYDNIPATLAYGLYAQGGLTQKQKIRRKLKELLEGAGLQEVISYSFVSDKQFNLIRSQEKNIRPISLSMPLSEERRYLRTTLIPNLLEVAQYNINHNNPDVRIYEVGTIFLSNELHLTALPNEKMVLAGLITGNLPTDWKKSTDAIDFYFVKGIVENLLLELGISNANYQAKQIDGFHPGRTAEVFVEEQPVGIIGQIHPELQEKFDLTEAYAFELDLTSLWNMVNTEINYKILPKYPAMQRDIAVVVDDHVEAARLINTIKTTAGDLLESLQLFDVYVSDKLGQNKKSIAFSLTFRNPERTLTDEEVTKVYDRVLEALVKNDQAELRK